MRRSLNILHTTEFYPPSLGGSQEVVRQLSDRLAARGHHVTVATSTMPKRPWTELNGVTIKEFNDPNSGVSFLTSILQ
jgi:glycogen synthase